MFGAQLYQVIDMKFCKKCNTCKPVTEFYVSKSHKDGHYPNCKTCHNAYVRKRYNNEDVKSKRKTRYAENRKKPEFVEKNKKRATNFYDSVEGRAKTLYAGVIRRQPDATVTYEQILSGIKNGFCSATGLPFDFEIKSYKDKTGRRSNPFSPSVDKIDPKIGYTPENTRIVIWQYNMMKSELLDAEVYLICKAVVEKYEILSR